MKRSREKDSAYKIDILAVGPHPDDVELWCGGLLARSTEAGYTVGILDLTRGERGTRGTPEVRRKEAQAAAKVLGVSVRENLEFPDCGLGQLGNASRSQIEQIVGTIRRLRPELLVIPYWEERHPDHVEASRLLSQAVFLASVRNFKVRSSEGPHVPRQVIYYQMRHEFRPSFVVDISDVYDKKLTAIRCYSSQVGGSGAKKSNEAQTLLSAPLTLSSIEARDRHYGAMIATRFGEPFLVRNAVPISDPLHHFRDHSLMLSQFFPA